MIVIFYGTSAELIKMIGVIKKVPREEQILICSSQHNRGLAKVHKQLKVQPDYTLSNGWRGDDVANIRQMIGMMLIAHLTFLRLYSKLKRQIKKHNKNTGTKSIAIVHGDTLTTVIGCYMGRILGLRVAHVEAGLRSGTWRSPFPEEIDRRIAAKFSSYHFAPNQSAIRNLKKENVGGTVIDTRFNTSKDAIEMAENFVSKDFSKLRLPKAYCLVLLHRTELIENRVDLEAIIKVLAKHATARTPVLFTEHTTTKEKIKLYNLNHYFNNPNLIILPKQSYFDYMAVVKGADYLVTDGGGLQEDAFFFGIPALVHRKTTERDEGIGLNATLSKMDINKVVEFLNKHDDKSKFLQLNSSVSPSLIVAETLQSKGFIKQVVH